MVRDGKYWEKETTENF